MTRATSDTPCAVRLAALQALLEEHSLDAFLVPVADEYQNEYLPECAKRLHWLTGFSGSAGMAVAGVDKAALFVDGRYTLQARDEVDTNLYEIFNIADMTAAQWIAKHFKSGARIGYDSWLHTAQEIKRYEDSGTPKGITYAPMPDNLIDLLWKDRPASPTAPVSAYPLQYAGMSSEEKRAAVCSALAKQQADAAIISAPASIMWLLNIRGADVPMTPFALCTAILHADGAVQLFIDHKKISADVSKHLGGAVRLHAPAQLEEEIEALGSARKRVLFDSSLAPAWFASALRESGARLVEAQDPCLLPKACKNKKELDGMRAAHVRDGLAVTRFLHWLHITDKSGLTETEIADKLLEFRKMDPMFRGPSFSTIAGAGPHGAIVHYHATSKSNRPLERDSFLLLDSGGQYPDGTTDITRTIVIGTLSDIMKERFTRVLKGHIAIASAVFPEGTTGAQLDALARTPLWEAGLDYDHGTGHGVGTYLSVHEGPQGISKRANTTALQPGMVLSNEPGYYEEGAYGIRIENLIVVVERPDFSKDRKRWLGFETITLAPIDTRAIRADMLGAQEKAWLDNYHQRILETYSLKMTKEEVAWLEHQCQKI